MASRPRRAIGSIQEPPINLTPLIDVVFVILIMFIVIAPLLQMDEVQLASAPQQAQHQSISVKEASPITVHVRRDNTILFNNNLTSLDDLPRLLTEAKLKHPQAKPQLFHDKRAFFGTYQTVKNAMEAAGFQEMEVVLSPS